jgi:glycine/D-amino acid oxidase-like deaminating enzyme
MATSPETGFPPLDGDGRVDVTVIGGGIAGITTAFLLKQAGLTVALIESRRIVTGATGYTTAKITSLHRLIYADLIDRFGSRKARQYADANQAGIEKVVSLVREYNIPCSFARKPAYTYADSEESREAVAAEADAARSLGLPQHSRRRSRCRVELMVRWSSITRRSSTRETTSCCLRGTSPERGVTSLRRPGLQALRSRRTASR